MKSKDDPLFIRSRITEPPEGPTLIKSKFVLTMNYITFDSQNNSEGERIFFQSRFRVYCLISTSFNMYDFSLGPSYRLTDRYRGIQADN